MKTTIAVIAAIATAVAAVPPPDWFFDGVDDELDLGPTPALERDTLRWYIVFQRDQSEYPQGHYMGLIQAAYDPVATGVPAGWAYRLWQSLWLSVATQPSRPQNRPLSRS